jgi:hypothetical protein
MADATISLSALLKVVETCVGSSAESRGRGGEQRKQSLAPVCVEVTLAPCINIECKFWLGDEGWKATVECLSLMVDAPDFTSAKNYIEIAIGEHIEKVLGISAKTMKAHSPSPPS